MINTCFLSLSFTVNDEIYHLNLYPPKSTSRSILIIMPHLHGLPIMNRSTIESAIKQQLTPYSGVIEITPVEIGNTDLLTPKYNNMDTNKN